MKNARAFFPICLLVGVVIFSSSCDEKEEAVETPQSEKLDIRQDANLGDYLVDGNGNTLYFFARDVSGTSECSDGCLNSWPVFYQEYLEAGSGVDGSFIGVITRADGQKQNTFKGWPLYYFSGDSAPGDINGEGAGGNWFVAKPDYDALLGEKVVDGQTERYLVDYFGFSLYHFTLDSENDSNCEGGCLTAWPPFSRNVSVVPSTIPAEKFGLIDGNNGESQATFDGMPLYLFNQDAQRGQVNGQGIGNTWFIVNEDLINQ